MAVAGYCETPPACVGSPAVETRATPAPARVAELVDARPTQGTAKPPPVGCVGRASQASGRAGSTPASRSLKTDLIDNPESHKE